jgi:hypothetical protein
LLVLQMCEEYERLAHHLMQRHHLYTGKGD